MMKRKAFNKIVGMVACSIALSPCAAIASGQTVGIDTMRIPQIGSAESIRGKSLIWFKEMLEEKANGQIRVEISHDSSYGDGEEMGAVEFGLVEAVAPNLDELQSQIQFKDAYLFNLPFLFSSYSDYQKVVSGEVGKDLLDMFNQKNGALEAIGFITEGRRFFIGSNFFKTSESLEGKTVIPEYASTPKIEYEAFGLSGARYGLDKQGLLSSVSSGSVVDATFDAAMKNGVFSKFNKVTYSGHMFSTDVLVVNRKWFNSLPQALQEDVREAAMEMEKFSISESEKEEMGERASLSKRGVGFYDWTEREATGFKKEAVSAHTDYLNDVNKGLLLKAYSEIRNK